MKSFQTIFLLLFMIFVIHFDSIASQNNKFKQILKILDTMEEDLDDLKEIETKVDKLVPNLKAEIEDMLACKEMGKCNFK